MARLLPSMDIIMAAPRTQSSRLGDLLDLLEEHQGIDEVLSRHQETLIGLEFTHALGALEELARRITRHIRQEEELLLGAYAGLEGTPPNAQPEDFREEHRRIGRSLKELLSSARGLTLGAGMRRAVILLLEKETRFKDLLAAHTRREEAHLYPRLKELWSAETRP